MSSTENATNVLRDLVVEQFSDDWFFDHERRILRRRDNPPARPHLVWAMYCALKTWWLKDSQLSKFLFPIRGDNMPPHPDLPRKYEWVSDILTIREVDLPFLAGGPLFGSDGTVLVEPRAGDSHMILSAPEANLSEDWELVPRGRGGVIRRKSTASNSEYTVEQLYLYCMQQADGPVLIAYDIPMERERATGVPGLKRRYSVYETWTLSQEDANYLTDGPLIHSGAIIVPESRGMAERISIDDIDSFSRVQSVTPLMGSELLRDGILPLSEEDVKKRIQLILGEGFQHKDWPGERSDVYTSFVIVNGRRVDSAFLLKGPGIKKDTMYIADLGKRGDQVQRLFTEPANLFVVQNNGKIDSSVRRHVRSEAENVKRSIYYCFIDGIDTARLLLAYGDPGEREPSF